MGESTRSFRSRLMHGDNLGALAALAEGRIRREIDAAGGIRLMYLDPPFATGDSFAMEVPIGPASSGPVTTLRVPAYRDVWRGGLASYLSMLAPRLQLLHDLLADDGSVYFHCDYRAAAAARLLLDEIFGPDRLLNEIVWTYGLGNASSRRAFGRKHDTILLYTKTDRYRFNLQRGEITAAMAAKYRHHRPDGSRFMRSYGKEYDLRGGKPVGSVWDIPAVAATSKERVGYPTQKPEALLERIILASSDPGDLVLDPFCGAGTTLAVASRLDRRWIGCDASGLAVWTSRKRLAATGVAFDVLASNPVDAPNPATLSFAYTLRPSVVVERDGDWLRTRLEHIEASAGPRRDFPADNPRGRFAIEDGMLVRYVRAKEGENRDVVTGHWSDWLDGWAVSLDGDADHVFRADWEVFRLPPSRSLPLISARLPCSDRDIPEATIRVTDVLGRAWTCTLPTERA
ncbi:MAG TPA: site-specific DNA-methyltransferase [Thermomicrobiales bacterium]|nr:site-specific DNA-methyltransferase [Thermomicrobiales bacterium]